MNILITGSGGYVGKNLKEYFAEKHSLLTPRSFELDLTNAEDVKEYFSKNDIDFIVHCGSVGGYRTHQDKDTTIEDNLAMVENILNNKKVECRVILFGSGAMYNKFRDLKKVNETEIGKNIPEDLYGKSKLLISELIKNRADVLCLNIFGCYGKHEKETRFPTYVIKQNLNHLPIEINQNVVFDYLFIEDLCKIIEFFIESIFPKENIINVTPTESISLAEIANIINSLSDYKSEIVIKNQKLNYEYTGSNQRLLSLIPDFEFTSYENGLKKLWSYINEEN